MYFFCRQNLFSVQNIIEIEGHSEETAKHIWTKGHRIENPIGHQTLYLDPQYGEELSDFFDTSVPVMSDRLIEKFRSLGVDNIDCYPVTLVRKDTNESFSDYKIVNFIGRLDVIDYDKSGMSPKKRKHYGAIYINDDKVGGQKSFRLRRGTTLLVVSDDVAKELIADNFVGLMLQPTHEYTGT